MKRQSGILMPIFSLPGKYGIGCFSREAYRFVDFLKSSGQKLWQILPIGPTSYGDSPYQSFSTFAGNPYFIDLEELTAQGLLTEDECNSADLGRRKDDIDYGLLFENRYKLLKKAYERAKDKPGDPDFYKKNEDWLPDYALFMALKDAHKGAAFTTWEDELRLREPDALKKAREKYADEIGFYVYLQEEFYRQWSKLKQYANEKGIRIIGDIPIYVSGDSSDVWANPELFWLDDNGIPVSVAGCPPDGFSATGQLWGNPLYAWEYHKKTGYKWWIRRMEACRNLYDIVRIDHFRGFDQYYSIPYGEKTAVNGEWLDGPGIELFDAIKKELGHIEVIAEDLGYLTDSVRKLVKDTGYPGMKVLEFAFDGRDQKDSDEATNDYLPFNYDKNCVVYTGTHDNETLKGWLDHIQPSELRQVKDYLNDKTREKNALVDGMVRLAMASSANMCVIPLQDYLRLDNEARINMPSTVG
ncbi:MAG: 4-alpha-glucanotransferase, partial [Lachnospiraceae bacterium]|nr:4-alpha-glucanotransferase [Lachnospiraceae bacterium]